MKEMDKKNKTQTEKTRIKMKRTENDKQEQN